MTLESFGGRKFVLTLVCVAVGTAVELATTRGVTASFAALLGSLVAAFGAANAWNTQQYLSNQPEEQPATFRPDAVTVTSEPQPDYSADIEQLKQMAQETAQTVVSMGDQIKTVRNVASAALKLNGG